MSTAAKMKRRVGKRERRGISMLSPGEIDRTKRMIAEGYDYFYSKPWRTASRGLEVTRAGKRNFDSARSSRAQKRHGGAA